VKYSIVATVPMSCTSLRVVLQQTAAKDAGTTLLFDDIDLHMANVPPYTMLQWSDDGDKTWSNELTASMGKIGEYNTRVIFRRLGATKRRIYRNTISEPVEVVITGAKLN